MVISHASLDSGGAAVAGATNRSKLAMARAMATGKGKGDLIISVLSLSNWRGVSRTAPKEKHLRASALGCPCAPVSGYKDGIGASASFRDSRR